MARYIDADKLKEDILKKYAWSRDVPCSTEDRIIQRVVTDLRVLIEQGIDADVAPKSEVEWLEKENARLLNLSEYSRSAIEQDITNAKAEVAREIFEDIEKHECHGIAGQAVMYMIFAEEYAKLKKKYTGEQI